MLISLSIFAPKMYNIKFLDMKKILLSFILIIWATISFAKSGEPEKSSPSHDTEIVRRCSHIDIEGKYYKNCVVTLKSIDPDYFITDKYKVKVLVEDENSKIVYKKTFKNCYLYIFRDGQIQVGLPNFSRIVIRRVSDSWFGEIKEKEGIW